MKKHLPLALIAASCVASPVSAADLDSIQTLTQDQFKNLSHDLAAILAYHGIGPAEPLGVTGWEVSGMLSSISLENGDVWAQATGATGEEDAVWMPRLSVRKGLPQNIDVGLSYFSAPDSNIENWGAEISYAFLEGSTVTPAMALRGTYSELVGVPELSASVATLGVAASKGFAMFTPYGGVGVALVDNKPKESAEQVLSSETFSDTHYYLGVKTGLGLVALSLEYGATAGTNSVTAKIGVGF